MDNAEQDTNARRERREIGLNLKHWAEACTVYHARGCRKPRGLDWNEKSKVEHTLRFRDISAGFVVRAWIYMISLVGLFVQLGTGLISPVLPLFGVAFNATIVEVGFLVSSYGVARVVLDIPSGMVADRFGLGRLSLVSLIGLGGGAMLSALAWDYNSLLAGRLLQGAWTALFQTSAVVAVARYSEASERGRAMSVFWGLSNVGLSLGPAVGGIVASQTNLRMPFVAYAAAALVGIALLRPIFKEKSIKSPWIIEATPPSGSGVVPRSVRSLIAKSFQPLEANISFMLLMFTSFVFFFVRTGVAYALIPLIGYYPLGLNVVTVGGVLTLSTFALIASTFSLGAYSDKVGRRGVAVFSLVILVVSLALIPLSTDLLTFSLFACLFGLSLGPTGILSAWVTDLLKSDTWATAIGIQRFVQDVGMAAGPFVLSLFVAAKSTSGATTIPSSSFNQAFLLSIILVLAATVATWRTGDPVSKRAAPKPDAVR